MRFKLLVMAMSLQLLTSCFEKTDYFHGRKVNQSTQEDQYLLTNSDIISGSEVFLKELAVYNDSLQTMLRILEHAQGNQAKIAQDNLDRALKHSNENFGLMLATFRDMKGKNVQPSEIDYLDEWHKQASIFLKTAKEINVDNISNQDLKLEVQDLNSSEVNLFY